MLDGRPMNTWRCTGSVPYHHLRQRRVVDRHRAPAEQLQALFLDDARPHALAVGAQALVARHEDVADGVAAGRRQREAELLALLLEEVVRDLNEHAGAVAGQRVGAHGAAMLEVLEDACSASETIWCDLRPFRSAMKPTPQASCSCAGS